MRGSKAWFGNIGIASLIAGLCAWGLTCIESTSSSAKSPTLGSLADLLSFPAERLAEVEIGRMNLLCAQGLPGADDSHLGTGLRTLADMAKRVRSETERHRYRFRQNPAEFDNSEGFFEMLMLTVVLEEDFGVRYNPERASSPSEVARRDGFFDDSGDVFLHGLLGPRRMGTCSSMPVLYVAVGRRLGYPLKLVTTKGHLFVRWEDERERFNVEATAHGLSRFDDDYYRHWPFEVTEQEVRAEGSLKSLTPAEELAVFLSIRGMCLREAGRKSDSAHAFAAAARLAPHCRSYAIQQGSLERELPAQGKGEPRKQWARTTQRNQ